MKTLLLHAQWMYLGKLQECHIYITGYRVHHNNKRHVYRTRNKTLLGMGNISILSYIVILRAHDNRIVAVLQLSSYHLHIISGAFT